MGAAVAVVAERGYETMRVADILEVAGVSRSAYYQHFANKEECFLAALDATLELASPLIADAYGSAEGSPPERLRSAFELLVKLIVGQPAAARAWFMEAYSAGSEGIARVERLGDRLELVTAEALGRPKQSALPAPLARAVLGGLRQIIHKRLRHEREADLSDLAPSLIEWALGYRRPAEALRRPRKVPALPEARPDPDPQRARILAAVTDAVAEKGYPSLVISEIAQRGGVSLSTFYALFPSGKGDVFVAALEDGERRLTETVLPYYERADDWPHAIKESMHAVFAFMAGNPATAKLGGIDVYSGGPAALARQDRTMDSFAALLYPGFQAYPETSPVAVEAIGSSISALVFQQLRKAGPERLYESAPAAVYLALAPFLGPEEATAVANESWRP